MDGVTFHELYQAHASDVHRFVRYLSGSLEEADEVTAETFLRAWTAKAPVRASTARSYLLAIARNVLTDEWRRRQRHAPIPESIASREAGPEKQLEFRETMDAVRALPQEYAQPLLMSAASGLSYEEIAEVLRLSLPTVKIRIHRARLRLAEQLQHGKEK